MNKNEFDHIVQRLDQIERRLSRLELEKFNANKTADSPPVQPQIPQPTVTTQTRPPTPPPLRPKKVQLSYQPTPLPPVESKKEKSGESGALEYLVGARGLPLFGSGLTILAIVFFTTIALTRGWITPAMIFGGAVALCLAFIGVGQFLRNEKEQFGQILTGVGSCGLYITFAAGHFAQNLYPTATMLALFVGLSLVNLGYGYWKASTAFLGIGVIGGFIASYLPLVQANPETHIPTHLVLHALIAIPAAFIIARHKWLIAAGCFLPLAIAFNVSALWMPGYEWLKVASLYTTALLGAFAYARSYKEWEFDPPAIFLPLILSGIAWIAFEVRDSYLGSLHIVALGLALAALSRLDLPEVAVKRLRFAALVIPLILAPWGASKVETAFLLPGLAIALALYGTRKKLPLLQGLSGIEALLGIAAYLVALYQSKVGSWQLEAAILTALILGGIVALSTIYKTFATKEQNLALGGSILTLLSIRLFTLLLTESSASLQPAAAFLIAFAVLATCLHALGARIASSAIRNIGIVASGSLLYALIIYASGTDKPPYAEHMLMGGVVLSHALFIFRLYWSPENERRNTAALAIILPASAVLAHLVFVSLTNPAIRAVPDTGWVWALLTMSATLAVFGQRLKVHEISFAAFISLLGTYFAYVTTRLNDPVHILWAETTFLLSLAALTLFIARVNWISHPPHRASIIGGSSSGLGAIAFWTLQIQQTQGFGIDPATAAIISGVAVCASALAVVRQTEWWTVLIPAWSAWGVAFAALIVSQTENPLWFALLLVTQIGLAIVPDKALPAPSLHRYLHIFITTFLVSRIGMILLDPFFANPEMSPALTTTWTALAVVFLIVGFSARLTEVRHAGLGLLILAAAKLIVVDLSTTDDLIRVAVTLLLGLAMIGGGYLYIRLQNQLFPDSPKAIPEPSGQPSQPTQN